MSQILTPIEIGGVKIKNRVFCRGIQQILHSTTYPPKEMLRILLRGQLVELD
jgi:2,4-dienoyl-CoA reductase-like NADH-dependent reductase (Old Yellow Enzyme family)